MELSDHYIVFEIIKLSIWINECIENTNMYMHIFIITLSADIKSFDFHWNAKLKVYHLFTRKEFISQF